MAGHSTTSMEQDLLANMLTERDSQISTLTQKLHQTQDSLHSLQKELHHKSQNRHKQREEHSSAIRKLKEDHTEQRRLLAKYEQNVKSGGGLRVHEYAALMRSANSEQVESSYVIRLQAQLCRAMHSLGVMESQLALVKENCSSLIKHMKEDLSHMVDDRTRREIELMNGLANVDMDKRAMQEEMEGKLHEKEELLHQVREEFEELGLEYDEVEVKRALEVKVLEDTLERVQKEKIRVEKELEQALSERDDQIKRLKSETQDLLETMENLKREKEIAEGGEKEGQGESSEEAPVGDGNGDHGGDHCGADHEKEGGETAKPEHSENAPTLEQEAIISDVSEVTTLLDEQTLEETDNKEGGLTQEEATQSVDDESKPNAEGNIDKDDTAEKPTVPTERNGNNDDSNNNERADAKVSNDSNTVKEHDSDPGEVAPDAMDKDHDESAHIANTSDAETKDDEKQDLEHASNDEVDSDTVSNYNNNSEESKDGVAKSEVKVENKEEERDLEQDSDDKPDEANAKSDNGSADESKQEATESDANAKIEEEGHDLEQDCNDKAGKANTDNDNDNTEETDDEVAEPEVKVENEDEEQDLENSCNDEANSAGADKNTDDLIVPEKREGKENKSSGEDEEEKHIHSNRELDTTTNEENPSSSLTETNKTTSEQTPKEENSSDDSSPSTESTSQPPPSTLDVSINNGKDTNELDPEKCAELEKVQ